MGRGQRPVVPAAGQTVLLRDGAFPAAAPQPAAVSAAPSAPATQPPPRASPEGAQRHLRGRRALVLQGDVAPARVDEQVGGAVDTLRQRAATGEASRAAAAASNA